MVVTSVRRSAVARGAGCPGNGSAEGGADLDRGVAFRTLRSVFGRSAGREGLRAHNDAVQKHGGGGERRRALVDDEIYVDGTDDRGRNDRHTGRTADRDRRDRDRSGRGDFLDRTDERDAGALAGCHRHVTR